MSDTKNITLTENAFSSGKGKRRSRKNQKGGGSTQGAIVQLQSTSSSEAVVSTALPTPILGINPSKIAEISAPILLEGGKKVVLKAKKNKTQKVLLSVAKNPALKTGSLFSSNKKGKKSIRKISLSLKNLNKKLHRAKTIKKHAEEKSIDEIKKILEEAKLIKVNSKAPEAMIRQIYNDYMTLKHKAL